MWRFLISQWRDNETKYLRGSKGDSPKLIERVRRHNVGHSFLLSSNNGKISLALLCFLSFTWILGTRGSTILCLGGTTTSHSKYLIILKTSSTADKSCWMVNHDDMLMGRDWKCNDKVILHIICKILFYSVPTFL